MLPRFEYAPEEKLHIGQLEVSKCWVDLIPVYYTLPKNHRNEEPLKLCVFLSGLCGNKESLALQFCDRIASRGFMPVFFDLHGHGERSIPGYTLLNASREQVSELGKKIGDVCFDNMYRYGWEILGSTVLDARRVIDYFTERFPISEVVMGGVSMGADIAVACAGVEERIRRVLAFISTPDWLRPGMHSLFTGELMDPGKPDAKSQWFYDQFNPITHLSRYARGVDLLFACGEVDTHIPPENAQRFIEQLSRIAPQAAQRMQIWWDRGHGHRLPEAENIERLFDWFLKGEEMAEK